MLQLTPQSRTFLAIEPVDFRAGIDRLAAFCRERLVQNPLEGAVYVFRNRRSTAFKLLVYDGQGFWLCPSACHRAGSNGGPAPRPRPGACPPLSCTSFSGTAIPRPPIWRRTGAGLLRPRPSARCSSRATRPKGYERALSDAPVTPPDRRAH
jgi:transposase